MKHYWRSLLILLPIFVLSACGTKTVVVPTAASAGALPSSLVTIEAAAEDIIDLAPSGNWDKINKDVTDISNGWKAYQPQAGQAAPRRKFRMR